MSTIAVKLKPQAERQIKMGHPWVFSDSITKISPEPATGDICILFDNRRNQLYAVGLYDEYSDIKIRILNQGAAKINDDFFVKRVREAFDIRQPLRNNKNNSYRLIYGENDFLPGIIADVYDDVVVLKLYSASWFPYFEMIKNALIEVVNPKAIVLRLSRNVAAKSQDSMSDGSVIYGVLENEDVVFTENAIQFSANVIKGHKTGFFLDHRQNRIKVWQLSKNKTVLDVFAYAGGFSVHALVGGAKEVTSVDISKQALLMAIHNAGLNEFIGDYNTIADDAFKVLKEMAKYGKKFDIVVIDPPSFAKRKDEIPGAIHQYSELAWLGAQLVNKKGILVLASCSSKVSAEEFLASHKKGFNKAGRRFKHIETVYHDIDHPVRFPEGAYLKCAWYSPE